MADHTQEVNEYRIGICLTGAASGGAYTAGVIDFLLEAFNEWEKCKRYGEKYVNGKKVPTWKVNVSYITGTSAGGLNAVLLANAINRDHNPAPRSLKVGEDVPRNCLYETWVKSMNYKALFNVEDIEHQKRVPSILYSKYMDEVVKKVFGNPENQHDIKETIPDWALNMHICLTVTNLNGIPHSFEKQYFAKNKFFMQQHRDYKKFRIVSDTEEKSGLTTRGKHCGVTDINLFAKRDLEKEDFSEDSTGWYEAVKSAQATAAFPLAFPAIALQNEEREYEERASDCKLTPNMHSLSNRMKDGMLRFAAVDGGVCNNEPFHLLEKLIERKTSQEGDPSSQRSKGWDSLIMIEPFPTGPKETIAPLPAAGLGMIEVMGKFLRACVDESNFKDGRGDPGALHDTGRNRFMIIPKRTTKEENASQEISNETKQEINNEKGIEAEVFQLASEPLYGFAGIIDEKIRYHDFMLGRKNCKHFLEKTLLIGKDEAKNNPIFEDYVSEMGDDEDFIQIVPTLGTADEKCIEPEWPGQDLDKAKIADEVGPVITNRLGKIAGSMADSKSIVNRMKVNIVERTFRMYFSRRIQEIIEGSIEDIKREKFLLKKPEDGNSQEISSGNKSALRIWISKIPVISRWM